MVEEERVGIRKKKKKEWALEESGLVLYTYNPNTLKNQKLKIAMSNIMGACDDKRNKEESPRVSCNRTSGYLFQAP